MANLFDLQKYAPNQPVATPEPAQQQAPVVNSMPAAAPPSELPSPNSMFDLQKYAPDKVTVEEGSPVKGMRPSDPIGVSPLSLMERAMLGWVRTPKDQEKYLRQHFEDVMAVPTKEGMTFSVQKDGRWFDVNPNFEWKFSLPGAVAGAAAGIPGGLPGMAVGGLTGGVAVPTLADSKNAKALAGSLAQDVGEYGIRAVAAGTGGDLGAAAGIAAGAPFGPLGIAAGGAIGGAIGAGIGATGAEVADIAGRGALMDAESPGARPYKDPDEINKELLSSAIFGAESFLGGKAIEFGASKVAKTFAKIVNGYRDTPEGHQAVRKLLGMLGAKPEEIEARLKNPLQNATYDAMRAADNADANPLKLGRLDRAQESVTEELHEATKRLVRQQGMEFQKLATDPKVKNTKFDLTDMFDDARKGLSDANIVGTDGQINALRELGEGDKAAINFLMRRRPMEVPYGEARAYVQDIGTLLEKGVFNDNIKRMLVNLKDGANQAIVNGLGEETGQQYGVILNKYATAKSVKEAMDSATSGNRRFSLGKKLLSENPNETKAIMDELISSGVDENILLKYVQMEGSRNADSWFTNKQFKLMGIPVPKPGNRVGASLISAGSQAKSAVGQVGEGLAKTSVGQRVLPYTAKAIGIMKRLPPDELKSVLMNPQALDLITGTIGGAAMEEEGVRKQLLQQVGVQE